MPTEDLLQDGSLKLVTIVLDSLGVSVVGLQQDEVGCLHLVGCHLLDDR